MPSSNLIVSDGYVELPFPVTWDEDPDQGAVIEVPKVYQEKWDEAAALVAEMPMAPYSTFPIEVPADRVLSSCTGFYAIARVLWQKVRWDPWPYKTSYEYVKGRVY